MNFSSNLKRLRKAAKLTQEELAHACGYAGQSRIGNYESGSRQPSIEELPAIAEALGVSIGELFGEKPSANRVSQGVQLDVSMVTETVKALRIFAERHGRKFDLETGEGAAQFVHWYAVRETLPDVAPLDNLIRLDDRRDQAQIQGADGNERSKGVSASGNDGRKRAVRRPSSKG